MKFTKKDITCVICNWMMTKLTLGAVRNFKKYYPDIPIIVVDDGSILNDTDTFSAAYRTIKKEERLDNDIEGLKRGAKELGFDLIMLPEHYGHGGAMDYGVDALKTRLLLTMDNDIRLLDGKLIDEYLEAMNKDPENIYAVGTEWIDNDHGDRWIGLWFSIFQIGPIKKWHLTFNNIVFPLPSYLKFRYPEYHCDLGRLIHVMLTVPYPHRAKQWKEVFFPNPDRMTDRMKHLRLGRASLTEQQIENWEKYLDG